MGNAVFKCVSVRVVIRKVRVLLPDGNIVLLDGPVEVADLMIEHPNHMVVHCSSADPRAMGKRPSMTIMRPDQELQPGEAYLVHPIPPQYKKALFESQPLSLSKSNMEKLSGADSAKKHSNNKDDDKNEKPKIRRQRSLRIITALLPNSQSKVVDSGAGADSEVSQTAVLDSDGGNNVGDEVEDEGTHINLYMGWRPALESIPESPLANGYNYLDLPASPNSKVVNSSATLVDVAAA